MTNSNKLGRPIRLGLISAGVPAAFDGYLRRVCSLAENISISEDSAARSAMKAVCERTQNMIAFNVRVGSGVLLGEHYKAAVRWLLDAGVDTIVCTAPLQDQEMNIVGTHQRAKLMGIPIIVAESDEHVDTLSWSRDVIMASADGALAADEAAWEVSPERCRIGGLGGDNAAATGVVAGVAMAELERSLPRTELLDSLRAWTVLGESRMAS